MKRTLQTLSETAKSVVSALSKNKFTNGLLLGAVIGATGLYGIQRHNEYSNRPEVIETFRVYDEQTKVFHKLDTIMRQGDDWYGKALSRKVGKSLVESKDCLNKATALYSLADSISKTNQYVSQYQKDEIYSGLKAFQAFEVKLTQEREVDRK